MKIIPLERLSRYFPFAIFIGFSGLYWITSTSAFSYDSLTYALTIEYVRAFPIHPYHLIALFPGKFTYLFLHLMGSNLRALFVLQKLNAIFAGGGLGIFFYLLSKNRHGFWLLLGTCLLGLNFVVWSEMTDAGSYAVALLATCFLLYLLISTDTLPPWLFGCGHGLAVAFHSMLILVCPAFLFLGMMETKPACSRKKYVTSYLAGLIFSTSGFYLLGQYISGVRTIHEAMEWVFGPPAPSSKISALHNPMWSFDILSNLQVSASGFVSSWISPSNFLAGLIVAILGGALIVYSWQIFRRGGKRKSRVIALWLWVLLLSLFQFFYAPGTLRFRVLIFPPLIYLVIEMLSEYEYKNWIRAGLASLIFLMAVTNYERTIWPASKFVNNPNLIRSVWVKTQLTSKDFFLFCGNGSDSIVNVYMAYFAHEIPARSMSGYFYNNPDDGFSYFDQKINEVRSLGGRLFVEKGLFDPQVQNEFDRLNGKSPGTLQRWISQFAPLMSLVAEDGYQIIQVH